MAGFRTFIKNIADSFSVKGFAENLEDGSVKVVCEGEEEWITGVVKRIKQNPPSFARIDEVSAEYEDYKGEFTSFGRRGNDIPQKATLDDLLGVLKSFDSKAEKLVSILSDTNVTLKSVKEDTKKIPNIKENTEKMLEKQDDTVGELKSLSQPFSFRKRKAWAE